MQFCIINILFGSIFLPPIESKQTLRDLHQSKDSLLSAYPKRY